MFFVFLLDALGRQKTGFVQVSQPYYYLSVPPLSFLSKKKNAKMRKNAEMRKCDGENNVWAKLFFFFFFGEKKKKKKNLHNVDILWLDNDRTTSHVQYIYTYVHICT